VNRLLKDLWLFSFRRVLTETEEELSLIKQTILEGLLKQALSHSVNATIQPIFRGISFG